MISLLAFTLCQTVLVLESPEPLHSPELLHSPEPLLSDLIQPHVCEEVCAVTYRLVASQVDPCLQRSVGQMSNEEVYGTHCTCVSPERMDVVLTVHLGIVLKKNLND